MRDFPHIPNIPEALRLPISSLVQFTMIFHGVLIQMAEGKPWKEVALERGEYLELGEKVLDVWVKKLGLDKDEVEPGSKEEKRMSVKKKKGTIKKSRAEELHEEREKAAQMKAKAKKKKKK